MSSISIANIEPGMILEADLLTPEGRFLLPQGTELSAEHIRVCKAWGVNQADIAGYDQEEVNKARLARIDPEILSKSKTYLKPFLKGWNIRNPANKEIVRIAIEQIADRIKSGSFASSNYEDSTGTADKDTRISLSDWSNVSALGLVRKQSTLISLPDTFFKIMEVMESPFSSANHIADVVSKDISLSAKLLRLVNSAFYGFPSKIDSISRAVAILGTKELTSLAMGISLVRAFEGVSLDIFSMEDFWKHSIGCGVFGGLIASRQTGLSQERFFVAGLLHDIGHLIMIKVIPDAFIEAVTLSRAQRIPVFQAENKLLGFDHARLGGLLCKEWKIPVALEQMIHFHHDPLKSGNVSEAAIIHQANTLAVSTWPETSREGVFPPMNEKSWESTGLRVGDISALVQQADRRINEIMHIFLTREKQ
ncbi:MAG: HDOD domain-containing protein [Desulfonatronovibrio sp.]